MSIKRILIPLPSSGWKETQIELGLLVGKTLEARVEAVFIEQPRSMLAIGSVRQMARAAHEMTLKSNQYGFSFREATIAARKYFTKTCSKIGMPLAVDNIASSSGPLAVWRELEGSYLAIVTHIAASFDLAIAASGNVVVALERIAKQAIFQTGRPVILAPSSVPIKLTGVTMIAWEESPQCWHAVTAAVPLLQLGKGVNVISIDRNAERRKISQANLLAYLDSYGIVATAEVIAPDVNSTGAALLAIAAQQDVGLLVMGASSHGRIHEKLFGGATHHILSNASSRSVFLAH